MTLFLKFWVYPREVGFLKTRVFPKPSCFLKVWVPNRGLGLRGEKGVFGGGRGLKGFGEPFFNSGNSVPTYVDNMFVKKSQWILGYIYKRFLYLFDEF